MGLLKALGWEDETPKHVDVTPEQDLGPQLKQAPQAASINVLAPKPHPISSSNTMFNTMSQPALTEEDKQKWQSFCMDIYGKARAKNPIYDNFLKKYEALAALPIPEAQKIHTVAQMLKGEGITRQQIIQAVQGAQQEIILGKQTFEHDHAARTKTGIEDVQKLMNDKQQQINILTTEIQQLGTTLQENGNKLAVRLTGFNTFFAQVNDKVNADANNIAAYVTE